MGVKNRPPIPSLLSAYYYTRFYSVLIVTFVTSCLRFLPPIFVFTPLKYTNYEKLGREQ